MSNASIEVAVSDLPAATAGTAEVPAIPSPSFGDIPLDCIRVSKTNPRKIFDENHLQDLAASIKKQGVAQPILVRPIETVGDITFFELVAGERRFRASRLAGNATVPAVVRTLTDREAFELQVLENLQRVDLHPLEEAEGFEALMKQFNVTADELAEKVGKSKAYIYASLKLCALEPKPRESFYAGALTKSTALLIARIPVKKLQEQAVREITEGDYNGVMSFRRAADHIENRYMLHLSKAAFKASDEALLPAAGSCTACPKRTGNQPEIFDDVKNAHVCTDPICYKAKGEAHVFRLKQLAIENGQTVLSGAEAKKIMPNSYGSELKGGYVQLDTPVYSDEKRRSYRQILGKKAPAPTLLESPHTGQIVHVVKLSEIAPLLKEKGHTPPDEKADSTRDREKEQEAKAKLEREYRKRLFLATHHASLLVNLVDLDLRLVALQMFESLPSNTIPKKLVMELYGWTDETFSWPDRMQKMKAAIDALTPAQLNQFIRDCALCRELDVNVYTATSKDKPENLLAFSSRVKVNAKQIRTEVEAEARAKADKKNKGAAKTAKSKSPEPHKVSEREAEISGQIAAQVKARGAVWPFPTSSRPTQPIAPAVATPAIEKSAPERKAAPAEKVAEELPQTAVSGKGSPTIAGVEHMDYDDLVTFIKQYPERLDELTKIVLAHPRGELVGLLECAANSLGYVYGQGSFHMLDTTCSAENANPQVEQAAQVADAASDALAANQDAPAALVATSAVPSNEPPKPAMAKDSAKRRAAPLAKVTQPKKPATKAKKEGAAAKEATP